MVWGPQTHVSSVATRSGTDTARFPPPPSGASPPPEENRSSGVRVLAAFGKDAPDVNSYISN